MELLKEFRSLSVNLPSDRISEEYELDYQENLPAYLDDVEKIIKCSSNSSIVDYEINSGCINLYGKTIISITYLSSQGYLLSNVFEEDFTKAIDISKDDNICFADVSAKTKYSSSRLINQRRIDIHISLSLQIKCFNKNALTVMSNCKNAFVREYKADVLMNKYASVTATDFDETFSVTNNSQIKNIVNVFSVCSIDEYKLIKEKMLVKIKTQVSILYVADDDSIQKFVYSFSSSKIIDVSSTSEDDKVLLGADISSIYIKTKTDSDNKINEIELVGRISISYKILCAQECSFITDSYIPHYETKLECNKTKLLIKPKFFDDNAVSQLNIQCENSIAEVLDLNAAVKNIDVYDSSIKFSALISVLYYDDDSNIRFIEKNIDTQLKLIDSNQNGVASINLDSFDYVIKNSGEINVKLNFNYIAFLYDEKTITFISDMEETGKKNLSVNPPLTLYFADKNENIWDIAKEYSTDLLKISEDNNLSDDVLKEKQILLISEM